MIGGERRGRRRPGSLVRAAAALVLVVGIACPVPPAAAADPQADAPPAPAPFTAAFLDGEDEWLMRDQALTFLPPDGTVSPTLQLPYDPGQGWINVGGTPVGGASWESARIRFAAPDGQALAVGVYENANRFREADRPQLDVGVGGSGCNMSSGRFVITELERDGDGQITQLALDFEHECESTAARLYGSIRLNATTPLSALHYAPATVDAGRVNQGETGDPLVVAVRNTGTLPQAVVPRLEGPDAGEFEITGTTCPASLDPGATCDVTLRFAPEGLDAASADLILADSTARGWREIDLAGMGLGPTTTSLTAAPASDFPAGLELTATVTPVPRGGSVRFWDGETLLGELQVPGPGGGTVTMYAALAPGSHDLAAEYVRADPYQASRSDTVAHVASLASFVTLDASTLAAAPGEDVRLFARVDVAGTGRATAGTLRIVDETTGEELATTAVTPANGELRAVAPDAAGHTIAARYSGAGEVSGSSGQVVVGTADTVAPAASIQLGSGAIWCISDWLVLRVEASDAAPSTGIDAVRYSADGVTWEPWLLWQPQETWEEQSFMERPWTFSGPDGPKEVWVQVRDGAGNVSTPASDTILLDRGAPLPRVPTASLAAGGTLGSGTVPVSMAYGTTDTYSGVDDYRLDTRPSGGSWSGVKLPDGATSVTRSLKAGTGHAFRSAAEDVAGNWSALTSGRSFSLAIVQDGSSAVRYGGAWVRRTPSWASGTSVRRTTSLGATARLAFSGRAVGIVAAMGPDAGRVAVYLDGVRVGTVDLYSASVRHRRIVRVVATGTGSHVLRLVTISPSAASDGRRVVIDAFVVMR